VLVKIVKEVWWPNVINPNSSQAGNNFFNLYGKRVRGVKLLNIYDRWGELVYSGQNLPDGNNGGRTSGWNGFFNGEKALPGVYVFYAEVQYLGSSSTDKFKGEFTLLR
jgi:gliding motility-associated-like protein